MEANRAATDHRKMISWYQINTAKVQIIKFQPIVPRQ